ncbi:hypothetical protein VNO77_05851 [Canavalia gladiata]|uniref:Uncharacterized protein n=1 Tax=Canavalia gladiata TaxID=3824 RepID=A0AAN9N4T3_CANGL
MECSISLGDDGRAGLEVLNGAQYLHLTKCNFFLDQLLFKLLHSKMIEQITPILKGLHKFKLRHNTSYLIPPLIDVTRLMHLELDPCHSSVTRLMRKPEVWCIRGLCCEASTSIFSRMHHFTKADIVRCFSVWLKVHHFIRDDKKNLLYNVKDLPLVCLQPVISLTVPRNLKLTL